jgi:CubicO group peptidase (beta-lactamase class C family)
MKQNVFDRMNLTSTSYKREDFINRANDISVLYRYKNNIWTPQADDWRGVIVPRNFSSYVIGSNGAVFSPMGGLYSTTA